jgi:hypothetical protein
VTNGESAIAATCPRAPWALLRATSKEVAQAQLMPA